MQCHPVWKGVIIIIISSSSSSSSSSSGGGGIISFGSYNNDEYLYSTLR